MDIKRRNKGYPSDLASAIRRDRFIHILSYLCQHIVTFKNTHMMQISASNPHKNTSAKPRGTRIEVIPAKLNPPCGPPIEAPPAILKQKSWPPEFDT